MGITVMVVLGMFGEGWNSRFKRAPKCGVVSEDL